MNPPVFTPISIDAARPPAPLAAGEVHLWLADLDQLDGREAQAILSHDERQRAARFVYPLDRKRFIAGRAMLRRLMGAYVGIDAKELVFTYGPNGKPDLASNPGDVRFNLSHSAERALYAFTVGRDIGVDVERLLPVPEVESIASHFLAASEAAVVLGVPEKRRAQTFLSYWTCKEAFSKATGRGMSLPLDEYEITFDESGDARVACSTIPGQWSLRSFPIADDCAAALAVEGTLDQVIGFQIDGGR